MLTKRLLAGALTGASLAAALCVTPAFAQNLAGGGVPWQLVEGRAYGLSMGGELMDMAMDAKMAASMKHAHPVARGTFFFMKNGKLYTASLKH